MTIDERVSFITKIKEKRWEGINELVLSLIEENNFIAVGQKIVDLYIYSNGLYTKIEKGAIHSMVQQILGVTCTETLRNDIYSTLKASCFKYEGLDIFKTSLLNFIPLKNGVYDVKTKTLLPHDPKYYFAFQFPVNYDETKTAPTITKFLDDTFTEAQRLTIEEWIGYIFHRNYMLKKALIIVGEGDTGKTTFLEMITALVSSSNISSVTLDKMSNDKFATMQMYNKHVNIYDELSAQDVGDTTAFKMATGNGNMVGEAKFGDRFQFINFAKLTFACNKIPDVKDVDDEAYFNRWMVIRLEKTIENKILNFVDRITTEEEISGLFNIAMRGLERLKEQGHFTYKSSGIDTKKEMMLGGNSVGQFAMLRLEQCADNEISKADMYDTYTSYCIDNSLAAIEIKTFGKRLQAYVPYIADSIIYDKNSMKGKQVRGWKHVAIKKTQEQQESNQADWDSWNNTININI